MLVRSPVDAVASFKDALPDWVEASVLFREYIGFYSPLMHLADRVVVVTFDQVVSNFGLVLSRVNRVYGSSFSVPRHDDLFAMDVKQRLDKYSMERTGSVPRYSETLGRDAIADRKRRRALFESEMKDLVDSPLVREANDLCRRLERCAEAQLEI
jgi:hypothetical protein